MSCNMKPKFAKHSSNSMPLSYLRLVPYKTHEQKIWFLLQMLLEMDFDMCLPIFVHSNDSKCVFFLLLCFEAEVINRLKEIIRKAICPNPLRKIPIFIKIKINLP